jgi:hypothetical protein
MRSAVVRRSEPVRQFVVELVERAVDRSGTQYVVRAYAHHEPIGAWTGSLEFVAIDGTRAVLRTGRETTQLSIAALRHWALGLGDAFLSGALERAQRREWWAPPAPHRLVVRVCYPIKDGAGRAYRPRVCARWARTATWVGWIEFIPLGNAGVAVRTGHETSQPSLDAVRYWAAGLEPLYFEGALERALATSRS